MRVAAVLSPLAPDRAEQWAVDRLSEWGLPTHLAKLWMDSAAPRLTPLVEGEIVLEYEADLGIVTCELWSDGQRLFGLDDWIG